MDLRAINLANLKTLVDEAGGLDELAELCGTSYDTLHQVIRGYRHKSGEPRMLGRNLKPRIEQAMNRPIGWLDQDHSAEALSQAALDFARWYDSLDDARKQQALGARIAISGQAVPDLVVEDVMAVTKPPRKARKL